MAKKKSFLAELERMLGEKKEGRTSKKGAKKPLHHRMKSWDSHMKALLRKEYRQIGIRKSKKLDLAHKALHVGWRKSKKTGKYYFEARKNRSDRKGTRL
jgi:hypothetical protein